MNYLKSWAKVLENFTVWIKYEHALTHPLPTQNEMLISVHLIVRKYFNIVFVCVCVWGGGGGGGELKNDFKMIFHRAVFRYSATRLSVTTQQTIFTNLIPGERARISLIGDTASFQATKPLIAFVNKVVVFAARYKAN